MTSLSSQIKRRIPWWGKIAVKVTLSRIPLAYRVRKRLSMFEHGPMDSPEYTFNCVAKLSNKVGPPLIEHLLRGILLRGGEGRT